MNPQRAHVEVDLLSAYLDRQVTASERARVEAHLSTCALCREEMASLRQTVAMMQALPRVPVPRAFTLSEAQVGIRRQAGRPAWFGGVLRGLAAVSAMALVAVIATTLLRSPVWTPSSTTAVLAPTPTAATRARSQQAPAAAPEQRPAPSTAQPGVAAEKPRATGQPAATSPAIAQAPAEKAAVASTPTPQPARAADNAGAQPTPALAPASTATAKSAVAAAPPAGQTSQASATPTPGAAIFGLNRSASAASPAVSSSAASTVEPAPPAASIATVWPSGAAVAYADGETLWVLDREGGARTLVQTQGVSSPIISSDRTWIAYRVLGQQPHELWAVRWDGSAARLLLSDGDLARDDLGIGYQNRQVQEVSWVPAQRTLAVSTIASSTTGAAPKIELWHVNPDSGARRFVLEMKLSDRLYYAPDGARFAVLRAPTGAETQGSLWLYNTDGSNGRQVLTFSGSEQRRFDSQLSWLPNASALWLAVPEPRSSGLTPLQPGIGQPSPQPALPGAGLPAAPIGQTTGQVQRTSGLALYRIWITGQAELVRRVDAFEAFWSPDGTRLALTQLGEGAAAARSLFIAQADGSAPVLYATLQTGGFSRWSPDSRQFLYEDAGQVYLGTPGRLAERLGSTAVIVDPRWIAPGQLVHLLAQGAGWLLVERAPDGTAASLRTLPQGVSYDVIERRP